MPVQDYVQIFATARPQVGPVMFDASITESHAVDVDYTDQPIEDGGIVSDHAIVRPRVLSMQVLAAGFGDSVLPPFKIFRHVEIWRRLAAMASTPALWDVVTTLEIYPRMAILHVGAIRSAETANDLVFDLLLRKIEFGKVDSASLVANQALDIALAEQDLGAQGTLAKLSLELAALA